MRPESPRKSNSEHRGRSRSLPAVCARIFGIDLLADFDFRIAVPQTLSIPGLLLARAGEGELVSRVRSEAAVFSTETAYEDGRPHCSLYQGPEGDLFHFPRIATFRLRGDRIEYDLAEGSTLAMMEICFLGVIFSYWQELKGKIALHASVVSVNDSAVAFLASPLSGKTSLAAAMIQRQHTFISDDIACLDLATREVLVSPSYPQMRMWPEQLKNFSCRSDSLIQVWPGVDKWFVPVGEEGFGVFCDQVRPLRCIYLPRREESADSIEISLLQPGEALIELVRSSFLPRTLSAAGLQAGRLASLKRIVAEVPVKRLIYPEGFQYLTAVCRAIEEDRLIYPAEAV